MVLFNYTTKEMTAKIVYYGPGLCGKTTNLQFIYDSLPAQVKKGKLLSLATKTDRTLFFDFLPLELGKIRGMKTRVQLYTVPGQVFYNSTRKLVLKGADGVVFVADSQQRMMDSNVESYRNLEENLREIGLRLEEMPIVMQFNKRDLPHLASIEEMNTLINRHNAPFYEAVATTGIGVEDTLKAVTKLVLNHLAAKYQLEAPLSEASGSVVERAAPPVVKEAHASSLRQASPHPEEGISLSEDSGEMSIEENGAPGALTEPIFGDPGREEGDEEILDIQDLEELEPLDALQATTPGPAAGSPGSASEFRGPRVAFRPEASRRVASRTERPVEKAREAVGAGGNLADLFGARQEETPEEILEILDETDREPAIAGPTGDQRPIRGSVPPSPSPPRAAASIPLASVPRSAPVSAAHLPRTGHSISPADPLGISGGGEGEMPVARAIKIGAVSPGKEHLVTVPLELSVGGKKLRLHLRMTLTLSD